MAPAAAGSGAARRRCDVAVVGAGPAGAAVARHLARSGCRVIVLERSRFESPRLGESLAPGVQPLLAELAVWPRFLALQPLPSYGTRSAWGGPHVDAHSHLATPYLTGWHIDRRVFDRTLAESAADAGADLMLGRRVTSAAPDGAGGAVLHVVDVDDPARATDVSARLVVDATGRRSTLARWLGARHAVFDRLVSLAVQFADPRAGTHCFTQVETTSDGWWYAAPIAPHRTVAMLMTDGDLARARHAGELPQWITALQRAALTRARIGDARPRWGPCITSAVSQRLVRHRGTRIRWLAVGDAALAVDPITGSGVVRALRAARAGAAAALSALSGIGDAIDAYERDRDAECTAYLVERLGYYAMEERWPDAPFWRRRAAVVKRLGWAAA